MFRIFKYKCPKSPFRDDSNLNGQCLYDMEPDGAICNHCGMSAKDADTIWDKIQSAYVTIVPYNWRLKNIWYEMKCRFWHRYTTIKPRNLGHAWCDRSHLLPHMVFEILCQFVEKELVPSFGTIDWDSDSDHQHARDEMLALHKWWTEEYDEEYVYNLSDAEFDKQFPWTMPEDYDGTLDQRRSLERFYAEGKYEELLRTNCKRVIDVSPYMWT